MFAENFVIDSDTGVVSLAESIANGNITYSVEVMAEDKGIPSLSSTYMLVVLVEDVNLNDPEFENPPNDETISVDEV